MAGSHGYVSVGRAGVSQLTLSKRCGMLDRCLAAPGDLTTGLIVPAKEVVRCSNHLTSPPSRREQGVGNVSADAASGVAVSANSSPASAKAAAAAQSCLSARPMTSPAQALRLPTRQGRAVDINPQNVKSSVTAALVTRPPVLAQSASAAVLPPLSSNRSTPRRDPLPSNRSNAGSASSYRSSGSANAGSSGSCVTPLGTPHSASSSRTVTPSQPVLLDSDRSAASSLTRSPAVVDAGSLDDNPSAPAGVQSSHTFGTPSHYPAAMKAMTAEEEAGTDPVRSPMMVVGTKPLLPATAVRTASKRWTSQL